MRAHPTKIPNVSTNLALNTDTTSLAVPVVLGTGTLRQQAVGCQHEIACRASGIFGAAATVFPADED